MIAKGAAIGIAMAITAACAGNTASAATIVGPLNHPTGVTGLETFLGDKYNVTFVENETYAQAYASSSPFFLSNPGKSAAAAIALSSFLIGAGATMPAAIQFNIPITADATSYSYYDVSFNATFSSWGAGNGFLGSLTAVQPFANFALAPAPTPIPATLPLFSTALVGLAVAGRRRRHL